MPNPLDRSLLIPEIPFGIPPRVPTLPPLNRGFNGTRRGLDHYESSNGDTWFLEEADYGFFQPVTGWEDAPLTLGELEEAAREHKHFTEPWALSCISSWLFQRFGYTTHSHSVFDMAMFAFVAIKLDATSSWAQASPYRSLATVIVKRLKEEGVLVGDEHQLHLGPVWAATGVMPQLTRPIGKYGRLNPAVNEDQDIHHFTQPPHLRTAYAPSNTSKRNPPPQPSETAVQDFANNRVIDIASLVFHEREYERLEASVAQTSPASGMPLLTKTRFPGWHQPVELPAAAVPGQQGPIETPLTMMPVLEEPKTSQARTEPVVACSILLCIIRPRTQICISRRLHVPHPDYAPIWTDKELFHAIRRTYRDELQGRLRRYCSLKTLKTIALLHYTPKTRPRRLADRDLFGEQDIMFAVKYPDRIETQRQWTDWVFKLKSDPANSFAFEFVEGWDGDRILIAGSSLLAGTVIAGGLWAGLGGDTQTVFTVMSFALAVCTGIIALLAIYSGVDK